MEIQIQRLLTEDVLQHAAQLFAADGGELKKLGDFENFIFEIKRQGVPYILRLTHSSHRVTNQIHAELNFVNYLKRSGVKVASALPSINDKLVERVDVLNSDHEASYFNVCLFEKVPGRAIDLNKGELTQQISYAWGKTIGHMHVLTKQYEEIDSACQRPQWDDDDLLNVDLYFPKEEVLALEQAKKVIAAVQALPKTNDAFGLIHTDMHSHNFFVDDGELYVFDFDDSSYCWFASDIAIPLYYAVWFKQSEDSPAQITAYAEQFFSQFLKGYYSQNDLSLNWIQTIPLFMKLRDVVLYSVLHKKWDLSQLNDKQKRLLESIKSRIERAETIVTLNYDKLVDAIKM